MKKLSRCVFHHTLRTFDLMIGLHDDISVEHIGLDNKTEAEALLGWACVKICWQGDGKLCEWLLYSKDGELFKSPAIALEVEELFLEPSSQPVKIIIKPPNPYKDLEVFILSKLYRCKCFR